MVASTGVIMGSVLVEEVSTGTAIDLWFSECLNKDQEVPVWNLETLFTNGIRLWSAQL